MQPQFANIENQAMRYTSAPMVSPLLWVSAEYDQSECNDHPGYGVLSREWHKRHERRSAARMAETQLLSCGGALDFALFWAASYNSLRHHRSVAATMLLAIYTPSRYTSDFTCTLKAN
jgi:hypothetical protein